MDALITAAINQMPTDMRKQTLREALEEHEAAKAQPLVARPIEVKNVFGSKDNTSVEHSQNLQSRVAEVEAKLKAADEAQKLMQSSDEHTDLDRRKSLQAKAESKC